MELANKKDLIIYSDIISDKHFITRDGSHRVLILKYRPDHSLYLVHMHNGDIIECIGLDKI